MQGLAASVNSSLHFAFQDVGNLLVKVLVLRQNAPWLHLENRQARRVEIEGPYRHTFSDVQYLARLLTAKIEQPSLFGGY